MAQAAVMLSPNLRMIHPSATGYCGKADLEKKNAWLNLQLVLRKLQTQCSQQLGRKQKRTMAKVQESSSPTHSGYFGILSIPHSLVLLCMWKLLIHQATNRCFPLGKDTMKPVRPVLTVHSETKLQVWKSHSKLTWAACVLLIPPKRAPGKHRAVAATLVTNISTIHEELLGVIQH